MRGQGGWFVLLQLSVFAARQTIDQAIGGAEITLVGL